MKMAKEIIIIPPKRKKAESYSLPVDIEKKIRVAAYCRVSTAIEAQTHSYESQVEYYTKYINEKPEYILVGIYGDEGKSGTGDSWRPGFQKLITDCRKGMIDLVITKSISRFARNTQDCLKYTRKLRELNIPILFEKEHINSMEGNGELFFTILSSLAQEESRSISENVKWGYRTLFKQGKVVVNSKRFYGFDKDINGRLIPNAEQAIVVKQIYKEFEMGLTEQQIAAWLNEKEIPGVYGKPRWTAETVKQMLTNEKYKGDLCLQKTYVPDYLEKRSYENTGQLEQYYVENDHEAIISIDEWSAVQMEIERRKKYREEYNIVSVRYDNPFSTKIICGECGNIYNVLRGTSMRCRKQINMGIDASGCSNSDIRIADLEKAFITAWNKVIRDKDTLETKWNNMIAEGTPLEKMRAKQMKMYAEQGRISNFRKDMMLAITEKVVLYYNNKNFLFLDGTMMAE